jgi:hypothetical protein
MYDSPHSWVFVCPIRTPVLCCGVFLDGKKTTTSSAATKMKMIASTQVVMAMEHLLGVD